METLNCGSIQSKIRSLFRGRPSSSTPVHKDELPKSTIVAVFKSIDANIRVSSTSSLPIVVVLAGGALSALPFGNRPSTKDIDVCFLNAEDLELFFDAVRKVPQKITRDLPRKWVNPDFLAFLSFPGNENLLEESVKQNTVLFEGKNIKVIAVDLRFQLTAKITRYNQGLQDNPNNQTQKYTSDERYGLLDQMGRDGKDILSITRRMVEQRGGTPLPRQEIRTWYFDGPSLSKEEIDVAAWLYMGEYHEAGIEDEKSHYTK